MQSFWELHLRSICHANFGEIQQQMCRNDEIQNIKSSGLQFWEKFKPWSTNVHLAMLSTDMVSLCSAPKLANTVFTIPRQIPRSLYTIGTRHQVLLLLLQRLLSEYLDRRKTGSTGQEEKPPPNIETFPSSTNFNPALSQVHNLVHSTLPSRWGIRILSTFGQRALSSLPKTTSLIRSKQNLLTRVISKVRLRLH